MKVMPSWDIIVASDKRLLPIRRLVEPNLTPLWETWPSQERERPTNASIVLVYPTHHQSVTCPQQCFNHSLHH